MAIEIQPKDEKRIDPRVRRTRKLLEEAFLELIQERNFQAITIQDIADRATVNRATFYAHFEDKYDLLDSFIREQFNERLAEQVPPDLAPDAAFCAGRLHLLIVTVLEYIYQIHGHCARSDRQVEPMFETAVQEELNQYLLRWFHQAPPELIQPTVDLPVAAMVWSWAIFGTGIQWASGPRELSAGELADQMVRVLLMDGQGETP
jgi:AcrR family transcriptional regulator